MTPTDEAIEERKGARVLVVEDDTPNARLLSIVLGEAGYDVCVTQSAEEAKLALESFRAQIVVLDLGLPGMNGLDFVRTLKVDGATRHIVVIAVTSSDDRSAALQAGCSCFVRKPIDVVTFPALVSAHLPKAS